MTLSELDQALQRTPGGTLRVDGNALSGSIGALFASFLPNGRFEVGAAEPEKATFNDGDKELPALKVNGTLVGDFLGIDDPKLEAWFFVTNDGRPEVAMTFSELPDLSRSFPTLPEAAAFSKCVFRLDSRPVDGLGDDFGRLFSPADKVRRGLSLEATLNISRVDETLANFGISDGFLAVKGPVELDSGLPRMRLATTEDISLPAIENVHLNLQYQYLTAPSNGHQKTKQRLCYMLLCGTGPDAVAVPLAITFEPNMLSDSITIESDWKAGSSPLRLSTLLGLLPPEINQSLNALIPQSETIPDIRSKFDLQLADLRVELGTDPLSLSAFNAGLKLDLDWSIFEGQGNKDLVKLRELRLDLSVSHFEDDWEVSPYLSGTMTLFGGNFSGGVELSTGYFCCVLDDDPDKDHPNYVDLKQLITHSLGLAADTFPFKQFALTRFEIWGDIKNRSYGIDIGTTASWELPQLGEQKVTIRDLFLKIEYDGSLTPALGGSLEIFGMTFGALASYQQNGWTFNVAALNIRLTDLLVSILGERAKPTELPEVTFPALELTVTPNTGNFSFHGIAEVGWEQPFGADAKFDCRVELSLERQATAKPVTCAIDFQGAGRIKINGVELGATIDVNAKTTGDAPLQLEAKGTLSIPVGDGKNLSFALTFATNKNSKRISASWPDPKHAGDKATLDFGRLASALGADISAVPAELIPTLTGLSFDYDLTQSKLVLKATTQTAVLAFLTAPSDDGKGRLYALGLKPPEISTGDMGALGSVFQGYSIALQNLIIVAANSPSTKLKVELGDQEEPISQGLLLKGTLTFKGTSFSYPFECNLGGKTAKKETAAITGGDTSTTTPSSDAKKPELEEGKNNVKVGQKIGPLRFRKVRFETRSDQDGMRIFVLLDASVGSGGFDLDLEGFNLSVPLAKLTKPTEAISSLKVGLDGLSITYSNPPLTIAGGFSRVKAELPYIDYLYTGHLLIKAETFQIAVFGSYGTIQVGTRTEPSLFAYGMYSGVIGGPAAFFVTGLALGGGYNTRLSLPPVEKVAEFPLVQAVTDPAKFTPGKLRDAVKPSAGDYWLALGIKFTSFKMADSFALFTVAFGNRLQFALLGLTKFSAPVGSTKDKCVVYAELAIRAVLDPDGGVFSIEGRLTSDSYVFSKEIRLVGGFAFYIWFGKAKEAGDFVISLGGYHPEFAVSTKPHYPVVPRIGVEGNIQNVLTIRGGAYLALTPSCLMAGLQVEAVFDTKDVRAAFIAYAHFIAAWAPFRYDARIGIGIAVTVKFLRSFKLEISADLHIWGPPFQGTARVTLYVLFFTLEFGERVEPKREPLGWPEFREQFLPARSEDKNRTQFGTIRISEGLQREVKKGDKVYRIVNPHELMIETDSSVPCSEVKFGRSLAHAEGKKDLGIRPMAAKSVESVQQVHIRRENSASEVDDKVFRAVQWSKKSFPEALWSPAAASDKPEAKMIENVPSGVVLRVQPVTPPQALGPFEVKKFKYNVVPKTIPWGMAQTEPKAAPKADFQGVAKDNALRTEIRASLPALTKRGWNPISLQKTSDNALTFFQAPPTVAALGDRL